MGRFFPYFVNWRFYELFHRPNSWEKIIKYKNRSFYQTGTNQGNRKILRKTWCGRYHPSPLHADH
ncbi:hypothetical protein AAX22_01050 [Oenococcus oeni]|nr:hypothetical protein AAX22_01050 [Oenococcus oeni]